MKLLNVGCGAERPWEERWVNIDNLYETFPPGRVERQQLQGEPNYVNADITKPLPFRDNEFDGALLSHVIEHFDAQTGLKILLECRRVIRPGTDVLVSVPDAAYFRKVYHEDRNANWPRLFNTTDPQNPIPTFFEAALWFNEHFAILTKDSLWCYLTRAGFKDIRDLAPVGKSDELSVMASLLNREILSATLVGTK